MNQWKLTDLIVEKIIFTDESVKGQITDSMSENLTDWDLEFININCLLMLWFLTTQRYWRDISMREVASNNKCLSSLTSSILQISFVNIWTKFIY